MTTASCSKSSSSLDKAEPILADIRDEGRLREIFERHEPDVVFHAAAHKHVPILESHPSEAVQTNVLGTWTLAQVAADHRCRLVHISTDKAADPCSIMGASKRVAELAVLSIGNEHELPFAAVRFGNVLGSRGSVVPTFFRQIVEGGPVTVTDPEMTRYFMTIPEAVSLVLQAGAMADKRKVFELEMGQPVKIIELARQMIRLAGHRPDDDIKIEIVGTRPGERLHEYLHDDAEIVEPTWHPSIRSLTPKVPTDPTRLVVLPRRVAPLLHRRARAGRRRPARPDAHRVRHRVPPRRRHPARAGPAIDTASVADARSRTPVADRSHRRSTRSAATTLPALLGGRPAFAPGLPFARPARPPLERVMRRLEPSYKRGMLTNGPLVEELEARIAERLGVAHVVALSSCTSGLMLVVQALTDGRPGPVVLPSFTFSASAHAVMWNGRSPALRRVPRRDSFQIDLADTPRQLSGASAIMATHVFGAPCDVQRARSARPGARHPGRCSTPRTRSARASTASRSGRSATPRCSASRPRSRSSPAKAASSRRTTPALAETLRIGRDYGNPGNYDTRFAGLNARMSEFHAAMALESLARFDESLERRRYLASLYRGYLADVPGIEFQAFSRARHEHVQGPHDPRRRRRVRPLARRSRAHAARRGCRHPQVLRPAGAPPARVRAPRVPPTCPVTDAVASSVLSLPVYPDLLDEHVERVCEIIRAAHEHSVELDAYVSTMAEVDARIFELD